MNKEKMFDCVNFKNELQNNLLKNSGAKNLQEYVTFANKVARGSTLHKETCIVSGIVAHH